MARDSGRFTGIDHGRGWLHGAARTCSFELVLPKGVVAGERVEGTVLVETDGPIANARRIEVDFRTTVTTARQTSPVPPFPWAGGGKHQRGPALEDIFLESMTIALPEHEGLVAGRHAFAFAFDAPAWLPPRSSGPGWAIEHAFDARVIVASAETRGKLSRRTSSRLASLSLPSPTCFARRRSFTRTLSPRWSWMQSRCRTARR